MSHPVALRDSGGGSCHPAARVSVLALSLVCTPLADYLIYLCLTHSISKMGLYYSCSFYRVRSGRCSEQRHCAVGAQSGPVSLWQWLTLLECTTCTYAQAWLCMNSLEHKSRRDRPVDCDRSRVCWLAVVAQERPGIVTLSNLLSPSQVVHEIRNYPYPQLHFLALQGLNPSRHTSAVRESYEVCCPVGH